MVLIHFFNDTVTVKVISCLFLYNKSIVNIHENKISIILTVATDANPMPPMALPM